VSKQRFRVSRSQFRFCKSLIFWFFLLKSFVVLVAPSDASGGLVAEGDSEMTDVVVTVPQSFGLDRWIAEGDPAGSPWSGEEWHFYLWGALPRIAPGERVYVVYNGVLRGYAPLVRIDHFAGGKYGLVRHGGAVAVSVDFAIPGFPGHKYRWWERSQEKPFPHWQDANASLFDRRVPRKRASPHYAVRANELWVEGRYD